MVQLLLLMIMLILLLLCRMGVHVVRCLMLLLPLQVVMMMMLIINMMLALPKVPLGAHHQGSQEQLIISWCPHLCKCHCHHSKLLGREV
jgi:hypothetical protein